MYSVIKELVLPPGSLWLIIAAGFGFLVFHKRAAALGVIGLGLAALYTLSMPVVATRLSALVQTSPPLSDAALQGASTAVIVVLSGGMRIHSPEYGAATVDDVTLARLRYAAYLHRSSGLPILVSGGRPPGADTTLARVMQNSMRDDFGIADVLIEDRSLNTSENARFSAEILAPRSLHTVILVTHASHMTRAAAAFSEAGLKVVAAPTIFVDEALPGPGRYLPRLSGLAESHAAIYEIVGRMWYALGY